MNLNIKLRPTMKAFAESTGASQSSIGIYEERAKVGPSVAEAQEAAQDDRPMLSGVAAIVAAAFGMQGADIVRPLESEKRPRFTDRRLAARQAFSYVAVANAHYGPTAVAAFLRFDNKVVAEDVRAVTDLMDRSPDWERAVEEFGDAVAKIARLPVLIDSSFNKGGGHAR